MLIRLILASAFVTDGFLICEFHQAMNLWSRNGFPLKSLLSLCQMDDDVGKRGEGARLVSSRTGGRFNSDRIIITNEEVFIFLFISLGDNKSEGEGERL